MRQVLLGTSKTVYSTADDYKVKIACCPVSSWRITVATGVVSLLGYIACGGHEVGFISLNKFTVYFSCLLVRPLLFPVCLGCSLNFRSSFFPIEYSGFLRVMFLFLVGLLGMGVFFTPVDIIIEVRFILKLNRSF